MAIVSGNIKLLKSSIMADTSDGGGAPTGTEIPDGTSNTIFPDISELDRSMGRVNLRKVFAAVQTDDTSVYYGANVIVSDPPDDPRVSISLFSTNSTFDTRDDARSRLESYLVPSVELPGYLYGDHISGQMAIQIFQRITDEIPTVGQTLVLIQNEGLSTEIKQYVRITGITVTERTFTYDTDKDYKANVITLSISDPLKSDFKGSPASRYFVRDPSGTKVRDTVVANAGSYAGVVPLAQSAAVGDYTIHAQSIYTQLVPSAQVETPLTYLPPYAPSGVPVGGLSPITYTTTQTWDTTLALQLPGGCLPGSLSIVTNGITIKDKAGLIVTPTSEIGTIDYANGVVTLSTGSFLGTKTITYTPATYILHAPQSISIDVTAGTRSQSYTGILQPIPQPGTLSISYMAQGRWYTLSDRGDGQIVGLSSSYGAGTLDPSTGSYVVTLGALPDVDTKIIITWNVPAQETQHPVTTLKASQVITVTPPTGTAIQPGSLTITWQDGTITRTATASTAGVLSGDATGFVYTAANQIVFIPNTLPAVGTTLNISYIAGPKQEDSFTAPVRDINGNLNITASLANIQPGSLEIEWNTAIGINIIKTYDWQQLNIMNIYPTGPVAIARDDGAGNIKLNNKIIGTVNYATGGVSFYPDIAITTPVPMYYKTKEWRYSYYEYAYGLYDIIITGIKYVNATAMYPNDASGYVKLRYNSATSTNNIITNTTLNLSLSILPDVKAQIVPGSITLVPSSGTPWGDSGNGILREYASGWLTRGTIDYLTGTVTLTSWPSGITNSFSRASCTSTVGSQISAYYTFRTAAAPIRPGSLTIQYATSAGPATVTANTDGTITGTDVIGSVDYANGVVKLSFGSYVVAAGNETEPWYVASNVRADGTIFKPKPIAVSTLKYNAVAYSYIPLSADILGIDPVRLPSDGRVPIFKPGSIAVVGNTGTITTTVTAGQTVDCGRVRLSRVRIIGANNVLINSGYTVDLEAGTVTFIDTTGYVQPITIEHRVEDMALIRDVQINGDISFTRPLTHNYVAPGSYVSSALIAGDTFARVTSIFDQATWNNTWSDALVGSPAVATFNFTQYPITVTNRGAITERWAIQFTNTTSFNVIGEHVGIIATGDVTTNCAPINPATNVPYFTIPALGWGSGWAAGNILRFNTIGAMYPIWVIRTIQQGPETVTNDSFEILVRGDVDTP